MAAKKKDHKMKEVKQISKQNSSLKNSPFSSTFPIYRKERPAHNVLSPTKWAHFLHIYTNRPIREVGQWFPKQTIPCRVGQRPRAPSFPHRTIKVEGGKGFNASLSCKKGRFWSSPQAMMNSQCRNTTSLLVNVARQFFHEERRPAVPFPCHENDKQTGKKRKRSL